MILSKMRGRLATHTNKNEGRCHLPSLIFKREHASDLRQTFFKTDWRKVPLSAVF